MEQHELVKFLFATYESWDLSPKQVAQLLNRSEQTLYRMRKMSIGPEYRQIGTADNAPVFYPIDKISIYLISKDLIQTTF